MLPKCIAFVLLLAGAPVLGAQEVPSRPMELDSLALVRLTQTAVSPRQVTGRLMAADSQALTILRRGDLVLLPLPSVAQMEVSLGRRTFEEGSLRGATYGLAGGAAITAMVAVLVLAADALTEDEPCDYCPGTRQSIAVVGVSVMSVTTVAGYLLGGLSPGERWQKTPLPVTLRPPAGQQERPR